MKEQKPSKLAVKLAERIKKEVGIEIYPEIFRTRAGHWQRSAGAWKWFMRSEKGGFGITVGSGDRATECLKAAKWGISRPEARFGSDIEIYI